jgi:hypothetical protein
LSRGSLEELPGSTMYVFQSAGQLSIEEFPPCVSKEVRSV